METFNNIVNENLNHYFKSEGVSLDGITRSEHSKFNCFTVNVEKILQGPVILSKVLYRGGFGAFFRDLVVTSIENHQISGAVLCCLVGLLL